MADAVIVHTLDDACAALKMACEKKSPVILQSAPDAIYYAGGLYLLSLFEQAKKRYPAADAIFVLDCSDAGAEAITAIETGHKYIRSSAPEPLRNKIADIAKQHGAVMME